MSAKAVWSGALLLVGFFSTETAHAGLAVPMKTVRKTLSRFAPDMTAPECSPLNADTTVEVKLEAAGWFAVPAGPRGKPCWVPGKDMVRPRTRAFGPDAVLTTKLAEGVAAVLKTAADLIPAPDAPESVGALEPGQDVEVMETQGDYVRIRTDKGAMGWVAKKALADAAQAVVKTSQALASEPGRAGGKGKVTPGDVVTVLKATKDYVKLKLADGSVGWAAAQSVAVMQEFAAVPPHLQAPADEAAPTSGKKAGSERGTDERKETAMVTSASGAGELTVEMWLQKVDGTVLSDGAGLKEGDEYEVHVKCSQDCYLRVTGETPENNILCQYSPIHVKGWDVSPLIKAGEDAWPKLLPPGARYKVFPPVMTQDIVRVEAIPASAGVEPFRYVPGKGNAPGCTPTSGTSRSVGIVFGSSTETPPAQPVPTAVYQRAFFTNPSDPSFTLLSSGEAGGSRGLGAPAPARRTDGPRISVVGAGNQAKAPGMLETTVRFTPRSESAPVDVESFRARLWAGGNAKDVTPQFKKFVTQTGFMVRGARLPAGSYKLELAVKDTSGKETVELVEFTVR
ncbi:MAG: hypothetical protein AB2A00_22025 [Myxococcota bacterium]